MRNYASYCAAKTRGQRVPGVDDLAGWDVGPDRRVGYVTDIEDGRVHIHLFKTEHGPPSDPPEMVVKDLDDVYRVCAQPSLPDRPHGRCYFHQGGPSGVRNGNFRHGRYSAHLPTRLAADFDAVTTDPELAALDYDIALVHSRIIDLIGRTSRGESGQLWDQLNKAGRDFQQGIRVGDNGLVKTAVDQIIRLTSEGSTDRQTWAEITEMVDVKRRLVAENAKVAERAGSVMTVQKALVMLAHVEAGLRRSVEAHTDQGTRDLIMRDFSDYMRSIYYGNRAAMIDA